MESRWNSILLLLSGRRNEVRERRTFRVINNVKLIDSMGISRQRSCQVYAPRFGEADLDEYGPTTFRAFPIISTLPRDPVSIFFFLSRFPCLSDHSPRHSNSHALICPHRVLFAPLLHCFFALGHDRIGTQKFSTIYTLFLVWNAFLENPSTNPRTYFLPSNHYISTPHVLRLILFSLLLFLFTPQLLSLYTTSP